jgi:hypothetical protein
MHGKLMKFVINSVICCWVAVTGAESSAQTITGLQVTDQKVQLGSQPTLVVNFRSAGEIWCGLTIDWGNGKRQDIRLGEEGKTSNPLRITAPGYPSEGEFRITVTGKNLARGLKSAAPCDVAPTIQPLVLRVSDLERERREEERLRDEARRREEDRRRDEERRRDDDQRRQRDLEELRKREEQLKDQERRLKEAEQRRLEDEAKRRQLERDAELRRKEDDLKRREEELKRREEEKKRDEERRRREQRQQEKPESPPDEPTPSRPRPKGF